MTFVGSVERTFLMILGSRELFALAILSVLFYAFYYPAPYQQQTSNDVALVVVDADQSEFSRILVQHLGDTRAVHVLGDVPNLGEAKELVRSRKADGILYFAPGLGEQLLEGRAGAGVSLWLNGSYFVRAEAIAITVAEVAADALEEVARRVPELSRQEAAPILVEPVFTTGGYRDYVFPAVANIILQQTLLAASARLMAERRRRGWSVMGLMEALGTLAACAIVGMLTAGFYFGFIYWVQDVPRAGNMAGLLLSIPLFAVAVSALGLFLGSLFRTGDDALKVLFPTSLPLVFLAGFAWPLDQMPGWLAAIAWLSPTTAAMHLFIRFNQMGATLGEAWWPFLIMAGLAVLYAAVYMLRTLQLNRRASADPAGELPGPATGSAGFTRRLRL